MWLLYALIRLIQNNNEPFLFSRGHEIWLFFEGSVFARRPAIFTHDLPECAAGHHLLALIDTDDTLDSESQPEPLLVQNASPTFPVHAANANPNHYRSWMKQRSGTRLGMPLWTVEELRAGYVNTLCFLSAS